MSFEKKDPPPCAATALWQTHRPPISDCSGELLRRRDACLAAHIIVCLDETRNMEIGRQLSCYGSRRTFGCRLTYSQCAGYETPNLKLSRRAATLNQQEKHCRFDPICGTAR